MDRLDVFQNSAIFPAPWPSLCLSDPSHHHGLMHENLIEWCNEQRNTPYKYFKCRRMPN